METTMVPPFLRGARVTLRPIHPDQDLQACWRWINDPDIRPFIKRRLPITLEEEREWLAKRSATDLSLGIDLIADGRFIGIIGLHRIEQPSMHATTGTIIGEKDCWGKGYGTEAKMLLLEYAFNWLNIRRISTSVVATNVRSLRCQKRCGYVEEGRRRQRFFVNGTWVDEILLGVLRDEWRARFRPQLIMIAR